MEKLSTYESALGYIEKRNFSVFPTHGIKTVTAHGNELLACTCGSVTCQSPGKHPAVTKGRNSSTKDSNVLQNLWAGRELLNVAVATGIESGIFIVDVDGILGEESLSRLESEHGKLPKTLTSATGRGRHLIFNYPARKVFNRTSCLGQNLDIRGDGGYAIVAPSKHISGVIYQWEDPEAEISDAPQWLLNLVCANAKAPIVNAQALNFDEKHEWKRDDVVSMLEFLDPNMGYSDWINVGMAIHEGGFSFDLWDSWSKRSSKYDNSVAFHWRSFKPGGGITMGTLVDMAKSRGWKPESYITQEKMNWETHPARDWLIEIGAYKPQEYKAEAILSTDVPSADFPIDVYNDFGDGIIGETIRWICDTAIKPQPVLAMLNTLTALGALFGRRYASPINTRTNLFTVGIAKTARGKDHSRVKIKEIMISSGLENYLASDEVKSGPGIGTTLEKTPACIMMLDEFGLVLQSISGDKAASYKAEISEMLLKLYTSAGHSYKFGTYADKKVEQLTLKDPHLCIFGTTTLETYVKALKKIAIHSGQLNRFIVLPGNNKPSRRYEDAKRGVPDQLLELWKSLLPDGVDLTAMNSSLIDPDITIVGWGDTRDYINKIFDVEDKRIEQGDISGTGELWGRYTEHIIKISMILAICRHPLAPVMTIKDIKLAEVIVTASVEYVIDLAMNFMYENDNERNKKQILSMIRQSGMRGIERKKLTQAAGGLKIRELDEIIKALLEEERIDAVVEKSGDRNKIRYRVTMGD